MILDTFVMEKDLIYKQLCTLLLTEDDQTLLGIISDRLEDLGKPCPFLKKFGATLLSSNYGRPVLRFYHRKTYVDLHYVYSDMRCDKCLIGNRTLLQKYRDKWVCRREIEWQNLNNM